MGHALGNNYGKFYSFMSKPVELDLNFTVDATNGNGLGVRSVKGQGVKNVYMATSASFTGTTHTSTTIDGISGGTSSLMVGMVIAGSGIVAGTTIVAIASSSSITISVATSSSVSGGTITYVGVGSPMLNTGVGSASIGYALVQLRYNYSRIYAGPANIVSPSTGGTIAINSTSLTVGKPYIIASVGHAAAGAVTIAPVADVSGSLASTWFSLYDGYGNTFILWFQVSGVGSAPVGTGGTLVQVPISTNATAANITTELNTIITNLASGVSGVFSFTASGGGTSTITLTSTQTNPQGPVAGPPADGAIATGFTFAQTIFNTNLQNWQAVGVPKGIVPNIGVSFIATASGSSSGGGSTGLVVAEGVSGIISIETIGDPNQSISPIPMGGSRHEGGWVLIQFLTPVVTVPVTSGTSGNAVTLNAGTTLEATGGGTVATTLTMTPTAPANNTVISMTMFLEQSVEVGGNGE